MTRRSTLRGSLALLIALAQPAGAERDRAPGFFRQALALPGVPAAMVPADLTGDGRDDLVVLVAYTGWTTRSEFSRARFDDIEGLVEVMNVVDERVERRELRLYPGRSDGTGFGEQLAVLALDASVHALVTGHPAEPLIAITDGGAAALRLVEGPGGASLEMKLLVAAETSFAGDGRFYPELELLRDLDGDGLPELLLPIAAGWAVHRGTDGGFAAGPAAILELPEPKAENAGDANDADDGEGEAVAGQGGGEGGGGARDGDEDQEDGDGDGDGNEVPPSHEIRFALEDCDGDGRLDLVVPGGVGGHGPLIYRGTEALSFAPAFELPPAGGEVSDKRQVMLIGDLDGDGRAEVVDRTELEKFADPGWRQEVDEAKRPLFSYAVRRLGPGLAGEAEPRLEFQATGYTFGGTEHDDDEAQIRLPGGFQDLDGDGRQDLVAITLEFSTLPMVMRVLLVQRISLTMNFHVWCQARDGGFREVPGLDLAGRFHLDLDNLRVRHLSQFAGDFDGDGRADFVQLGRGKTVTIHQGRAACRYPALPDRTIRLERKLRHLGLARILDLDGDGRSDLYVVHPLRPKDGELSIPARVDLYLSRF